MLVKHAAAGRNSAWIAMVAAVVVGAIPFGVVELFRSRLYVVASVPAYLAFHNIVEFFSIMVSLSVFGVGWFTHDQSKDRHILLLACAVLGVGLMDFMHAMSFTGMPDFFTANVATKTSQFWLAARFFGAVTLLVSAFVLPDSRSRWLSKGVLLPAVLMASALVFTIVNFYPRYLPLTFDPATGLTPFKVYSEYVITALLLAAVPRYLARARRTGDALMGYYTAAFVLLAYSELVFTTFQSMFDTLNALGHVYKVCAYYLIYRAVFIGSVQKPYLALVASSRALHEEVAARTEAEDALRSSEQKLALHLDQLIMAVIEWDSEFRVRYWNPAAERIFGYSRDEALGRYGPDLITPKSIHPQIGDVWRELMAQRGGEMNVNDNTTKDGRLITCEWYNTRLTDASGAVTGVMSLALDVSGRRQAEEGLLELNRDLERRVVERTALLESANRELEAFAYSVSHDLRAPLRHIGGFIELLRQQVGTGLDAQGSHYLAVIAESARGMGSMIDDLLAFSRMGRSELTRTCVDVAALVHTIINELGPDVGSRTIDWKVGELPLVTADCPMLRLALANLLSNAVKFTRTRPRAQIEVGSTASPGGADVVLFVRDNGVGFDIKYVDKLFRVFQRLHRSEDFEGTGIGLANVRRIVERHGGRTWAESPPGGGATFFLSLPALRPAQ